MFRKLALLFLFGSFAWAQDGNISVGLPSQIRTVISLPATCNGGTTGQPMDTVALITNGASVQYNCTAPNIWTIVSGSSGTGNVTHSTPLDVGKIVIGNTADDVKIDSGCSTDGAGTMTCAGKIIADEHVTSGVNGGLEMGLGTGERLTPGINRATFWGSLLTGRWMQNPNGIGDIIVPGIATPATGGNCTQFAPNGIDLIDAGGPCTTLPAAAGNKVLASPADGSNGPLVLRALVPADLPSIPDQLEIIGPNYLNIQYIVSTTLITGTNQVRAIRFVLTGNVHICTGSFQIGTGLAGSFVSAGIYNKDRTQLLVDTHPVATDTAGVKSVTITPCIDLPPGTYWQSYTATTGTTLTGLLLPATVNQPIFSTDPPWGTAANTSIGGQLPATLGIINLANIGPLLTRFR